MASRRSKLCQPKGEKKKGKYRTQKSLSCVGGVWFNRTEICKNGLKFVYCDVNNVTPHLHNL